VSTEVWVALPLACLVAGAFGVYLIGRLVPTSWSPGRNRLLAFLTALAFVAALTVLLPFVGQGSKAALRLPAWGNTDPGGAFLRADPGAMVVLSIALGLAAVVAVYSGHYMSLDRRYEAYYPLLLLLVTGLGGMLLAGDLFNLYLFCELMSVTAYALVGFRRHTDTAIEAGFKYLIMGSLGTIILLMGISFTYRASGRLDLVALANTGLVEAGREIWARVGLACILVGLAVKTALVPVHTWLPDAHGRAPSSVSAMLSGIVIQSAFYVLLKVGLSAGLSAPALGIALIALALLNMTLGNGMALVQSNTKRLLAYSTVAQMGYVMLSVGFGLRYRSPHAIQAGFFLLSAHAAMKGLAFLSKGVSHFYCGTTTVGQLRGTSQQLPLVAVCLGLALGGLAGVPPLAGFAGKWFILSRAVKAAGAWGGVGSAWVRPVDGLGLAPLYVGLALLLLNGLLALAYYLPLIGKLFTPSPNVDGRAGDPLAVSPWMAVPLLFLGGLVVAMGLYPRPWLEWMADVGDYLLAIGG
jgi:proton-translocating NADH-quinone oxidoreductase chain N